MEFTQYRDLLAKVRGNNEYHSIKGLVQPDDPEVMEVAQVLAHADDFVRASQDFVHTFTTYRLEIGDYWATPAETIEAREGDCDDKAILLLSLLRNKIPAENVFAAFGRWVQDGKPGGHMWVVMNGDGEQDRIIEATASADAAIKGRYSLEAIFNDKYTFAYPQAIKNFDLRILVMEKVLV